MPILPTHFGDDPFKEAEAKDTLDDYAAAVDAARKREPKSDLLNYWHYRLRLADTEQAPSTNSTQTPATAISPDEKTTGRSDALDRDRRASGISLSSPRLTAWWGLGTGLLLWGWVELGRQSLPFGDDQTMFSTVLIGLLGISMSLFLLQYVHHRTITWISFVPLSLYLLTLLAIQISPWQSASNSFLTIVLFVVATLLMLLGTLYFSHAENQKSPTAAITAFVNRVLEAFAVGGSICIILAIFLALGAGLLSLIGITLGESFGTLIVTLLFGSAPFWSMSFIYNPEEPLVEQKSVFSSENFLSNIAWVLLWVAATFLLVYLVILSPTRFDRILETGNTVPLFGSIVIVIQSLIFIARPTLAKTKATRTRLLSYGLLALSLIQVVLSAVALYAISARVEQYALTEERVVGMLTVLMLLLLSVWATLQVFAFSSQRFDLPGFIRRQTRTQIVVGVSLLFLLLGALLFGNLEYWSLLSQVRRASKSEDPTIHLDRDALAAMPVERAKVLVRQYEGGSDQYHADAILAIYEMKQYWERTAPEGRELNAQLDQLAEGSPKAWQEFINIAKTSTTLHSSNTPYPGQVRYDKGREINPMYTVDESLPNQDSSTTCSRQIEALLGYSKVDALTFCDDNYALYNYR